MSVGRNRPVPELQPLPTRNYLSTRKDETNVAE